MVLRSFSIPLQKFQILNSKKSPKNNFHIITHVGYQERVKAFFEKPPEHKLRVGDLVTCTCHGGIAVVIQLFDGRSDVQMNMARVWWIKKGASDISRDWMHTISRLNKLKSI